MGGHIGKFETFMCDGCDGVSAYETRIIDSCSLIVLFPADPASRPIRPYLVRP